MPGRGPGTPVPGGAFPHLKFSGPAPGGASRRKKFSGPVLPRQAPPPAGFAGAQPRDPADLDYNQRISYQTHILLPIVLFCTRQFE